MKNLENLAIKEIEFMEVLKVLRNKKIPCRLILTTGCSDPEIMAICGWDYPESLCDDIWDATEHLKLSQMVTISADHSGGTRLKSEISGNGPKRYNRF